MKSAYEMPDMEVIQFRMDKSVMADALTSSSEPADTVDMGELPTT